MCLILHKPAGASVPRELIDAAAAFNRDGWGLMGYAADGGLLLERAIPRSMRCTSPAACASA